jgi:hypothetical protein
MLSHERAQQHGVATSCDEAPPTIAEKLPWDAVCHTVKDQSSRATRRRKIVAGVTVAVMTSHTNQP